MIESEIDSFRYVGNGTSADYDYPFRIDDDSHVELTITTPGGEELDTLVLDTDYSVDPDTIGEDAGGTITLIDTGQEFIDGSGFLDDDYVLTMRRSVPLTQETDIRNQGPYHPEIIEDELDRQIMVDQMQQSEIDRCVKVPVSVSGDDFDPTLPADLVGRPGYLIGEDSEGAGLSMYSPDDVVAGAINLGPIDLTEGQAAEDITGWTLDAEDYSSAEFKCEIQRGTTVFMNQSVFLQRLNGAWVKAEGNQMGQGDDHGVTWTVTESGGIAQVRAAVASDGHGDGTLKIKRVAFDA